MSDKMILTPESLAQYHYDNAVSGQGETRCVLCRPEKNHSRGYYPWPCPVWVAAHPEDARAIGFGYGWNLVETKGDPPTPRSVNAEGEQDGQ